MHFLLEKIPDFDTCYKAAVVFQFFHICVWFYTWVKPDKNPKMNEWKYHGSKAFYYLFITMAELRILAGYPWLPEVLGGLGKGNWEDAAYRASMTAATAANFHLVYYAEIFYHSFSSFTSVLPGNRTKPEMFLHHIITMFLLIGSYQADHCPEGTTILMIHNAPDVWTSLTKSLYARNMKYVPPVCVCPSLSLSIACASSSYTNTNTHPPTRSPTLPTDTRPSSSTSFCSSCGCTPACFF